MRKSGALKVVIATCALALILPHLSPASAAPAAQLVTCVDLASSKERISKTGICRTTEATAKWRLAPIDSAIASGSTTKTLTVCSNKESSPFTYQLIRTSCYKHMQSSLYTRSSALPNKPVIVQVSSSSHESASLALASDPAANLDAPIAYYTITTSKGDVKKVSSWRDLNVTVSGLRSSTSYTFTITATSVDGTSSASSSSPPVTTQVYVAPAVATTAPVTYAVGDAGPGGGKIFYVANTPFACGPARSATCTYLEAAAPALWNGGLGDPSRTWAQSGQGGSPRYDTGTVNNAISPETATATAIGWGYRNTLAIILQGSTNTANSAAALADAYSVTVGGVVFDDWFLPSKDELMEMYDQRTIVGGIGSMSTHWSSSENPSDANEGWGVSFSMGIFAFTNGKNNQRGVRPIRAF
jgi:hypothetical protein